MFESDLIEWEHLHPGVCVCFYDRSAGKITVDEVKFLWGLLIIDSQLGDKWWKKLLWSLMKEMVAFYLN